MKVLASDFDGTLYFGKEEGIHEKDKAAIRKFQAAGGRFGLCSGRPFIGMQQFMGDLQADFYIQNSGAHILDKEGHTLYEKTISQEICRIIADNNPGFFIIFFGRSHLYTNVDMGNPFFQSLEDMKQNPDESIYGFSVRFKDPEQAAAFVPEIQRMPDLAVYQNTNSIDCVARGCSKAEGIRIASRLLGFDEVACIGDSYNDIPMLESSDYGFTFRNSPASVQEKAHYLVDSIAECIDILL